MTFSKIRSATCEARRVSTRATPERTASATQSRPATASFAYGLPKNDEREEDDQLELVVEWHEKSDPIGCRLDLQERDCDRTTHQLTLKSEESPDSLQQVQVMSCDLSSFLLCRSAALSARLALGWPTARCELPARFVRVLSALNDPSTFSPVLRGESE